MQRELLSPELIDVLARRSLDADYDDALLAPNIEAKASLVGNRDSALSARRGRSLFERRLSVYLAISQRPETRCFESVAPRLLPGVRNTRFFERYRRRIRAAGLPPDSAPVHRIISGSIAACILVDSEMSMRFVTHRDAARWGVQHSELIGQSLLNLQKKSRAPFDRMGPGLFVSPWRDSYDSSRLLLIEKIEALPIAGTPFAMVPHRDLLVVSDSAQPVAIRRLIHLASESLRAGRAISASVLKLDRGRWVALEDGDLPGLESVRRMERRCDQVREREAIRV